MGTKPEFKMEGDKLKVSFDHAKSIDKDNDGVASASVKISAEIELDASEVADEMLKNSAFVEKIKAKLGIGK